MICEFKIIVGVHNLRNYLPKSFPLLKVLMQSYRAWLWGARALGNLRSWLPQKREYGQQLMFVLLFEDINQCLQDFNFKISFYKNQDSYYIC